MSDVFDDYKALNEFHAIKKKQNLKSSVSILDKSRIPYRTTNGIHFIIGEDGDFDFWPSTGKFIGRKNRNIKGRGVFNLLKYF